jgi:acyl-coenzyme A synthetase/AMP-(fatty) acid ligase
MQPASWLHPSFRLHLGDDTLDAVGLLAEAATLAESVPLEGRVGLLVGDVRSLLRALLACEQRRSDLFIIRDATADPGLGSRIVGDSVETLPGPTIPGRGLVWLQTSGSTGTPKWVPHRLDALTGLIAPGEGQARWGLTYHPASFAGLQVILSAALGGHVLVAASGVPSILDLAALAIRHQITHLSATPTFWRSFLIALPVDAALPLKAMTLGGEIADQALLDALQQRFPGARCRHIYATTEAGAVFSVGDGKAGFPAAWLASGIGDVRLAITEAGTLAVASPRTSVTIGEGFLDTGDCVVAAGDRILFRGRGDTMVNIGGVKVWAEEVEAYLLALPFIRDALVSARPNPVTGHILTAEIVLVDDVNRTEEIKAHLQSLPRAMRPAAIRLCSALPLGPTGKKLRNQR